MLCLANSGATDKVFPDMMTYTELNEHLGIEHYQQLWDRYATERK
jgi:hypothetical protein